MDIATLRRQLEERLVEFSWDEWAQMGVLAAPKSKSRWAQDPEALIVFTLEVARVEPRLFDELLDWMLLNEALLSIRRLRAMCIDANDRSLLAGTVSWLGRQRPRARLRVPASEQASQALVPLFHGGGPAAEIDPSFAAAGLLRPLLDPSGKSRRPDLTVPINLGLRLRAILGVGIRPEVVRIMLTAAAPWMTAQALAGSSGYAKRNVHEALTALTSARVLSAFTVGGEQRYMIDKAAWAALLQVAPRDMPVHRDWPQLLAGLRTILRWCQQEETGDASDYLRASSARQLLDRIRSQLAFAGIAIDASSTAESAPQQLEVAVDRLLGALNR